MERLGPPRSARCRPVEVPVLDGPGEPAVVPGGHQHEPADGALAALLVAVEEIDRERLAGGQGREEFVARKRTRPEEVLSSEARTNASVDFPEPFAPEIASTWPA